MAAQIRRARYNEYASLSKNYLLGLSGMGIYDAMKLCKADVSTVCLFAAFMGAFLLASGTKGKKFCMPKARLMIHQPLGTAGGKKVRCISDLELGYSRRGNQNGHSHKKNGISQD
ncbi:ATP-dependent Clp protease proteolytic subunit [Quillaja saponaria]|uniref:ATP-dependent Clp protease proteolytic subunit n=1 Tax=Quillaja saponaria TaxID=32244 RepID=A0AAD7L588_QUISA|nr:ATP-dependent Clp protease proteolytic subunit [Quillaja saponaria]